MKGSCVPCHFYLFPPLFVRRPTSPSRTDPYTHERSLCTNYSFFPVMIIHFLSGQNITITVGEKEKVATVKKRVSEIMSTPHESISLLYNGTILDDELMLDAYSWCAHYV